MKEALKRLLRPVRNAYYRGAPRLRRALLRRRDILLYVNNEAMTSHIWRYYESVRAEAGYRFFLYAPETDMRLDADFQRRVKASPIRLCAHPARHAWSLIVCADLRTPASFTRDMCPLLYVNHGLHILSSDGGRTFYAYGPYARGEDGKPKFTRMLEPNLRIAEAMKAADPELAAVISPVGYKFASGIETALAQRDAFRAKLGVAPDVCLVGFFGTWREHSLFHALGEGLFPACEALRADGYQFLFSIHPKEYARYDEHVEPMGELVESQRRRGMLVRSPSEDFLPYLAACDIVVSDYGSMAESAILLGRRLIFSPYPDGMVCRLSLTAEARRALPALPSPAELPAVLSAVRASPLHPFIAAARDGLLLPDHDERVRRVTRELV
ncbi:MAG: hypothetical protein PHY12_06965 [Eubacteriales bacterium]|nr:hypothetical protein [Eubacteriales bacterium]